MVKADAYGLGMAEAVSALEPLDPWGYGVAAVEEGVALRGNWASRNPFSSAAPFLRPRTRCGAGRADRQYLRPPGSGQASRRPRWRLGCPGRFHLEVDTGMGRAGFDWHRVEEWAPGWTASWAPIWSGKGASPTSIRRTAPTRAHRRPVGAAPGDGGGSRLRPEGLLVHACNSPGALRLPGFAADAVRPGIFLYGGVAGEGLPPPAPVASLRARIVFLRRRSRGPR